MHYAAGLTLVALQLLLTFAEKNPPQPTNKRFVAGLSCDSW